MAICAHFISGSSGEPVTTLLAFPRQRGRHSGVAIAETIGSIIADYGLQKRLGYFITDNASNNSTALDYLAMEFGFDKKHRWIHCAGHVLNLVAQAILFGNDTDVFEEELNNLSIEELELQA